MTTDAAPATKLAVATGPVMLRPDPTRVVLRPFIPAQNPMPGSITGDRSRRIAARVLALPRERLGRELDRVELQLGSRHRDVRGVLRRRYDEVGPALAGGDAVSADQALLIAAYFMEEYAFEAAALFNPSIVAHPDQGGVAAGALRVILSLRGVGEGHISSITFRTGSIDAGGVLAIDPPSRLALSPAIERIPREDGLEPDVRLVFDGHGDLSEQIISPVTAEQRHGLEDLRLARFVENDGRVEYIGTLTAFSGEAIRQELLRTRDFRTFELSAVRGAAGAGKGMALFPRRVGGRYLMLGRHDHETISLLASDDLARWEAGSTVVAPSAPWEFVQIGNCGSPIELDAGWLVLTHGVGPIRNYAIGACLLDRDDPSRLLARLPEPIVSPGPDSRDGYASNVVYSCGAIVHAGRLILPYGVADSFCSVASVEVNALLDAMRPA